MARASRKLHDLRSICGGVPIKYVIRCEECGHQAVVTVVVQGGRVPQFKCSWCGVGEPTVEQWECYIRRSP